MNIVCEKCERILRNNRWEIDVIPIERVSYTICPECLAKESRKDRSSRKSAYEVHNQDRHTDR